MKIIDYGVQEIKEREKKMFPSSSSASTSYRSNAKELFPDESSRRSSSFTSGSVIRGVSDDEIAGVSAEEHVLRNDISNVARRIDK